MPLDGALDPGGFDDQTSMTASRLAMPDVAQPGGAALAIYAQLG